MGLLCCVSSHSQDTQTGRLDADGHGTPADLQDRCWLRLSHIVGRNTLVGARCASGLGLLIIGLLRSCWSEIARGPSELQLAMVARVLLSQWQDADG